MTVATNYPTTDTAVSGTWTTPTNVQAEDAAVASVTIAVKNTTNDREQGGYGFDASIPANSTITSVALEVKHKVSGTGGIAFLGNVGIITATLGAVNSDNTEPTVLTALSYGSYARPGGGSWARADLLDGTFKTRVRARSGNNATSVVYSWDYIRVAVDYAPPIAGTSAITSAASTLASSGTNTPPAAPITGTSALTAAASTTAASGTNTPPSSAITGTSALTSAASTTAASGTNTAPPPAITGTSSITSTASTSAATGSETFAGTSALTSAASTSTATGAQGFTATSAIASAASGSAGSGINTPPTGGTAVPARMLMGIGA